MKSTYGFRPSVILILILIMHIFPAKSHAGKDSSVDGAKFAAPYYPCKMLSFSGHDDMAFTQGFFFHDSRLFETTGRHGESSIRINHPVTGEVLRRRDLDKKYFGEGACVNEGRIFVLTWTQKICLLFSASDLSPLGSIKYSGQGWGLTFGEGRLIQSDGSSSLIFRDPETFRELYRVDVTDRGEPVTSINELEFVDGFVLANIWRRDVIAAIDPGTGRVEFWIDISSLRPRAGKRAEAANGIAWDAVSRKLYVTGKFWNRVFEIKWPVEPEGKN